MATVFLARSAREALTSLDYLLAEAVLEALAVLEREMGGAFGVGHAGHT